MESVETDTLVKPINVCFSFVLFMFKSQWLLILVHCL